MNLIHCIYSSRPIRGFRQSDLPKLLESSRAKNEARGITGMLLFIEGMFFQALEGDADDVEVVYNTIACDARHDRVTQIIREPIPRRRFGQWSMGFVSTDALGAASLIGQDFIAGRISLNSIDAARARKMFTAFARS